MFIVGIVTWWYGAGWGRQARSYVDRIKSVEDYFSIDLLLKTLFSPYRQISAGRVDGSLNVQMHAFFDRLISRMIGAMIRLVMIIVGGMAIVLYGLLGVVLLVIWGIVPLLPIVGLVLAIVGWVPWAK